jgi:hypothetical protein
MRCARFGLLFAILALSLAAVPSSPYVFAQQAPSTSTITRDAQALTLLGQALSVAGGATAIAAITDYTATGTGTWYQTSDHTFEGAVTINGTASGQLRFDAHLPAGVRSYAVNHGRSVWKNEDERLTQAPAPHTRVPSSDAFPYKAPMFAGGFASPNIQIAAVLNDSLLEVSYKGSVQIDGRPAHKVQVRRLLPGRSDPNDPLAEYGSMDFFIDASTYQVVMTQDVVPKHVIHQLRYSDYRPVKGVVVPFSITESMGSQQIWAIQLDQISFDSGLQDSSFDLQ